MGRERESRLDEVFKGIVPACLCLDPEEQYGAYFPDLEYRIAYLILLLVERNSDGSVAWTSLSRFTWPTAFR